MNDYFPIIGAAVVGLFAIYKEKLSGKMINNALMFFLVISTGWAVYNQTQTSKSIKESLKQKKHDSIQLQKHFDTIIGRLKADTALLSENNADLLKVRDTLRKHLDSSSLALIERVEDVSHKLITNIKLSDRNIHENIESRARLGGGTNYPLFNYQIVPYVNNRYLLRFSCFNSSKKYPLIGLKVHVFDVDEMQEAVNTKLIKLKEKYPNGNFPFIDGGQFSRTTGDHDFENTNLDADEGVTIYNKIIDRDIINPNLYFLFTIRWSSGMYVLELTLTKKSTELGFVITKVQVPGNSSLEKYYQSLVEKK